MAKIKALGLCGSLRKESWNLKLVRNFQERATDWDMKTYPSLDLPNMNEDVEAAGLPTAVQAFRAAFKEAPVIVIASPEYNAGYSGALKNAIDWASRPPENLWAGKVVVLLSASPGAFGGVRGLIQLRSIVSNLKSWVLPEQVILPHADQAFQGGKLTNEIVAKQIDGALAALKGFTGKVL